jgi:hypothetical protein
VGTPVTSVVAFFSNAGFCYILKTRRDQAFIVLSIRQLGMVIISPIASAGKTKEVRILQQSVSGQMMQATTTLYKSSQIIHQSVWAKLNPYTFAPTLPVGPISDLYMSFSEHIVDYKPVGQDMEQTAMMFVGSSRNAHNSIMVYIPGTARALTFIALINQQTAADAPPIEFVEPIEKQKEIEIEIEPEMENILKAFEEYIKTGDSSICERFSVDGSTHPSPDWMSALNKLPWTEMKVSKEDAIDCVKLQNRIMKEQDILKVAEMVTKINLEIETDEFNPEKYRLKEDENESNLVMSTLTKITSQTSREISISADVERFTGWSLFESGSRTEGFMFNTSGDLVRFYKENEAIIHLSVGTGLVSVGIGIPVIVSGLTGGAVTIASFASEYVFTLYQICPIGRDDVLNAVSSAYSMLPSSGYLWTEGIQPAGTVILTTVKSYPAAVFTATAVWYYQDDIRQIGAGAVGLVVLLAGGYALYESASIRKNYKRKFNKLIK